MHPNQAAMPVLAAVFRRRKRAVGTSWRMDETCIKVAGQWKYLYRAIKRVVRPMLGFKTFRCARVLIAGIETMHILRKGPPDCPEGQASPAANQFYSLAF